MRLPFSRKKQIIGIDLSSEALKAVVCEFNRATDSVFVLEYAMLPLSGEEQPLGESLRLLFHKLRTRCKECAVTGWPEGARLKFLEGKKGGSNEFMRAAMRADSRSVLHEALSDYVFDCDKAVGPHETGDSASFIGCGIPRAEMNQLHLTLKGLGYRLQLIQLTPIAVFNAFSVAYDDIFNKDPFLLVHFGKTRTAVVGGSKAGVRLMRMIEFGSDNVAELRDVEPVERMDPPEGTEPVEISYEDELIADSVRHSMFPMTRELTQSLGFLQMNDESGRLERLHISGALSGHELVLQILTRAVDLPCVQWNPFRRAVAKNRAIVNFGLLNDLSKLPAAAGAAFQCLL